MSEANIDQNRDNVKHTGHVSATRALREPRYSIIDLQKAYAEGRAEAIAQERERLRVAVEGLPSYGVQDNWVPDGFGGTDHENVDTVSRADVLALLSPDTGATTGGES